MKTKVLDILGEPIVNGGQETFILNMYNNMDKDKIQIDILTPFYCDNMQFKENVEKNGGKVFIGNLSFDKNRKKNFNKVVSDFLKDNKYNIVHIQSGSIYSLMTGAKIAKKAGVENVIVHSHCGGLANLKYRVIKTISRYDMLKYPTEYWACSKLAAEWKFPKKIIKNGEYKILKNAIDTSKIYFSKELREKTRKELELKDENLVIGHIGRFSKQKNHELLIDIFKKIYEKNSNAILLLIGTGELEEKIINKVKRMKLEKNVKFLGIRKDINELLNAMDVFLLPSLFEGLPVVGVEAQATGLFVVTSDKVTKELPINDLVEYCPLDLFTDIWADKVIEIASKYERRDTTKEIKDIGYDVKSAAELMQKYYLDMENKGV